MKGKFLFAKNYLGMLISAMMIIGCSNTPESNTISSKSIFKGLYTVEYENSDIQYVWIFTDDMKYILYPGSTSNYINANKSINFESPAHYYVMGNKFYSCGMDVDMNPTSLKVCKDSRSEPDYKISKIDTIEDTYFNEKFQVIQMEDYYSKKLIKMKKKL